MIITIPLQIKEVKRELRQREKTYPKWVAQGWMQKAVADYQIRAMEEVLATLEALVAKKESENTPTLFSEKNPE